ncbi:putative ribonuclease H protein [Citrus sinensis]|nr:putative ribonuclease H protein [Citrus sinensis]
MIKNDVGQWIHDEADIKAHVVYYFFNLYMKEGGVHVQYPFTLDFPLIDNDVLNSLIRIVDDAEIKDTIFSISPMKAPGVEGLMPYSSKLNGMWWGPQFVSLLKIFFSRKQLPKELNQTLIVLIPKTNNPDSLKLFRPISLCTVVYKTITKLVANCLKTILPQLIGPAQTSFVPGRHIIENVIVAQEIIHSMKNKGGKTGQMAIKVDLEKAYDRLSWDFIQETLGLTESFILSRGMRQGDPLSPYIFVMCIERLNHGINQAVRSEVWKPIRLIHGGIPITHLFFADDLLLLAEASGEQAHVINKVLDTFCLSSGEKVNRAKTQIFFSRNVQKDTIREIKNTLGFSVTKNLGKYLGMPILHSRVTKATYQEILDKVMASKYKIDTTCLPNSLQTRNGSYLWRAVEKVWDHDLKGTHWALGDGTRVKLWWDLWLNEADNLQSYAQNPIPDQLINLCVVDFSYSNGNWNWQLFAPLLPNHIILKIAAVKAPCANSGEDQCYWTYSNTGHFTAKSAYLSLHQSNNVADNSFIRTFIWLAISNRLKTKFELHRRHITTDATCCSCGHYLEDTIHVLRDCIIAWQVWLRLVPNNLWNNFFDLDLTSWIYYNLKNMGLIRRDEKWPCIFCVALWWIWYWQTQFIHNEANISVVNIVLDIIHRATEINSSMKNIIRPGHEMIIKCAGGLIRNYCGEWVHGFGMNIGHCTITGAKVWGLFQGLQLAWNIGIRQLRVEVDSRCTIKILATNNIHPNAYSSLIQGIKRLPNRDWQVSLSHSYRETNFAADYLANQALLLPLGIYVFPTPPSETEGWLLHDVSGSAYPRMVVA